MSEQLDSPLPPMPNLAPDAVSGRQFPSARRGLDADAVRRFLDEVATTLRALRQRDGELVRRLGEAERRASAPSFDQATLTAAVGAETARVLQAAHEAARDLVARAEERAEEILASSTTVLERRHVEAEAEADEVLDKARAEAAGAVERVTEQCRSMVEEAKEVRRRILADLAQRRRQLHIQLEQLRAGKDALEAIVETAANSVESLRVRLSGAEEEASVAAGEASAALEAGNYDGLESVPDEIVAEVLLVESTGPAPGPDEPFVASDPAALAGETGAPADSADVLPVSSVTTSSVDELFAKIRASRADEVARAREVLGGGDPVGNVKPDGVDVQAAPEGLVDDAHGAPTRSEDDAPSERPGPGAHAEASVHTGVEVHDVEPAEPAEVVEARAGDPRAAEPRAVPTSTSASDPTVSLALGGRDALLAAPIEELERRLKRSLREDQNELLDGLRNLPRGADPAGLLPGEASRERLHTAAIDVLALAYRAGEVFASPDAARADTKLELGDVNVEDREGAEPVMRSLAEEIVSALRARIESGFVDAHGDEVALGEVVGGVFREWRGEQVEKIAGDFAGEAFARGVIATATAAGVPVRWIVDDGDGGCPDCDDNALAEPLRAGEPFPTGHRVPPVHPGCRCILVPVRA